MEKLTKEQLLKIENWIYTNARPLEIAKWKLMWNKGPKDQVLDEMLKYQNLDGGFGKGLESDILIPESSAIASAEAIFTAFNFDLNINGKWFEALLNYFVNTKQNTPSYWEAVPQIIEEYPRAPWWNYKPDTEFTPNPCAVVAAAMLLSKDSAEQDLGKEIAERCIALVKSDEVMWDHDIYCVQRLFIVLQSINSELLDEEVVNAMNKRIKSNVSLKPEEYMNYVAQPFDFINSPKSPWYKLLKDYIPMNVDFYLTNLNEEGIWTPNFSWGVNTEESRAATINWKGYMAVKRVKILKTFGYIED